MSRGIKISFFILVITLQSYSRVNAQSNEGEKERLARTVERLVEAYGNPFPRKGIEYFGISIDPQTGNVSHIYEDVDGRVRRGKMFKENFLFNLRIVDPLSIEVYDNIRWWTIRLRARKGEEFTIHSVRWDGKTERNEDHWWAHSVISQFCGTETEERADELADYLRRLVQLYQ